MFNTMQYRKEPARLIALAVLTLVLTTSSLARAQVYGPDLIVQSISPSVANPALGQHFNTTIIVRNNGNLNAGPFYLMLHSDRASEPTTICGDYETYFYFDGLAAGQSSDPLPVETWYDSCGSHTFWAWVDGCNNVGELSETNNKLSRQIQLAQPDLIVQSLTSSIASPALGVPFTMTVTLRNQGSIAAGPFYLLIDRDRATAPNLECAAEQSDYIAGLAPNATVSRSFSVMYTSGGPHTFWARVDGCGQVCESNESNNRTSRTMQVAAADLVVDSVGPSPSFVLLNSNHSMTAVIRNAGSVASNACVVQVFKNSAAAPTLNCSGDFSVNLPSIAPQQTRSISFTVSYNTTGDKVLRLWADGCGIVEELDEGNNQRSTTLRIRRGANLVIDSITPTDSPVRQLNSTSIDVVIRNAGDVATPTGQAIAVHALLNSSTNPTCSSFDRSLSTSSLAAGASRTVRFTNITYAWFGAHTFRAKVDPCDAITESSGSDNSRGRLIDVHLPI